MILISRVTCVNTHTWKTLACHEEIKAFQQRAFSGNDRIFWKFNMSGEFSVSLLALLIGCWLMRINGIWLRVGVQLYGKGYSVLNCLSRWLFFFGKFAMIVLWFEQYFTWEFHRFHLFCPICSKEDETLEHLFLLCPIARVVWFGSELSLRINHLRVQKIKDWIGEWLSKPELQHEEALWFYGQLVCNLWCILIHRNEVIFNNKRHDPVKIISHQNFLLQWISKAN